MPSALEEAEALEAAPMSALDEAEALPDPRLMATPAPRGSGTARDVAARQLSESASDPDAVVRDTATTRGEAGVLGAARGLGMGDAGRALRFTEGMGEPVDVFMAASDPQRQEVEGEIRRLTEKAEKDRPGEFLAGEVAGSAVPQSGVPLPTAAKTAKPLAKLAAAGGKAVAAAGEGAVYAANTGGDVKTGAAAGAAGSALGQVIGKAGRAVRDRLAKPAENRAATAAAATAARETADTAAQAAKPLQDAAATARAAADRATAIAKESAEAGRASAPAQKKTAAEAVKAALEARQAAFAALKAAKAAERTAKKTETAAAKAADGSPSFVRQVAGAVGATGVAAGYGASAIPEVLENPDKAVEKGVKAVGLGLAGAALLKGKRVAGRVAGTAAARLKGSTAAAVTAKLGERVATGARRVGAAEAAEGR